MKTITIWHFLVTGVIIFMLPVSVKAQKIYQFEKPGKWSISNRVDACEGQVDKPVFTKNLNTIGEWFHQNHPMMKAIKGFDLQLELENSCYSESHQRPCDYSYQGSVYFSFQLFSIENGKEQKWIVEPPQWKIRVNSAWSGHGTNFGGLDGYRVQEDDPKLEVALNNAVSKISEYFCVFELEKEIAPGIRLYKDDNLVVFNPDRPDYWIPVTVKEVMQDKMNYWKIKPNDKMVYDHFVNEYQKFTPDELNSLAYNGSEDPIIDVSAKPEGLQIMRFNPEYWDRSLPKPAVQFMTMHYPKMNKAESEEHFKNNGHPDYGQLMMNSIKLEELVELISRKK